MLLFAQTISYEDLVLELEGIHLAEGEEEEIGDTVELLLRQLEDRIKD